MTVVYPLDGHHNPPKGVLGGHSGQACYAAKLDREGDEHELPSVSAEQINPGRVYRRRRHRRRRLRQSARPRP